MIREHDKNVRKESSAPARALLAAVIGIGLAGIFPARAEAQTYQLTNIGVITGAVSSRPVSMDDRGGVIRVTGTSTDKFGNYLRCWYWDSGMTAGAPLPIGEGFPADVNSLGEVVGKGPQVPGQQEAFYWKSGVYTKLPYPSTTPDGAAPFIDTHVRSGSARGINEAGVISGVVYREDLGVLGVVWQKVAGVWQVQYLKLLPGTPNSVNNSAGVGRINEAGDIAGSITSPTQTDTLRAVVWKNLGTPANPVYDFPTDAGLPSESVWLDSGCQFLNDNNAGAQVLGGYTDALGAQHQFLWVPGSAPVSIDLTIAPKAFSGDGAATGLTNTFAGGANRAFYYKNGTITDCGSLGGGTSSGYGVNSAGEVCGISRTSANSATYAFVWKDGVMKKLESLVPGGLGPFTRLTMTSLTSDTSNKIGDSGAIIGEGIAKKGGYSQAYLLRKL